MAPCPLRAWHGDKNFMFINLILERPSGVCSILNPHFIDVETEARGCNDFTGFTRVIGSGTRLHTPAVGTGIQDFNLDARPSPKGPFQPSAGVAGPDGTVP